MRRCLFFLLSAFFPALALAAESPLLVLDAGGHTARVNNAVFTPDGKQIVTVADDKTIRLWDVATGECVRVLRPPAGKGPEGMLYAAALAPDGKTLAVAGYGLESERGCIFLIALDSERILKVLRGHSASVYALSFSADGRRLASGSGDKSARVWNVATGKSEQVLQGHVDAIYGIAFAPTGDRLATASLDKTGRIWSAATGKSEATLSGHTAGLRCLAWAPDGKNIATGCLDGSIRTWDAQGTAGRSYPERGKVVSAVAFAADSRRLLYALSGARPYDCVLLDLESGQELTRFSRHSNAIQHAALARTGKVAVSAGGNDHETFLWKSDDATLLHSLTGKGKGVISAGWADPGTIAWGNTPRFNSTNDRGPLERSFTLATLQPDSAVANARRAQAAGKSVALEAKGNNLVVQRAGRAVPVALLANDILRCYTLWTEDRAAIGTQFGLFLVDTQTGKTIRELKGHTGLIWAVAPSPDGRFLLSASSDQTLRVWTLARDEPLLALFLAGAEWIVWTPEGYYAASPGGEKLMGWQVSNGPDQFASFHPAARFHKSLHRPDVIRQLLPAGSLSQALAQADKERGQQSLRTEVAKVLPPRVALTAPAQSGLEVAKDTIEVQATATSVGDQPIALLRLLLDGRPYTGPGAVKKLASPRLGEVRESWTVTLTPGKHRLAVQAETAVSQAVSDEVAIAYAGGAGPQTADLPSLYVLAVGVAAYKDEALRLNYSAKDAQAVERTFREKSKGLFRKVETRLITDQDATRAEILKGLNWLRRAMTQRDIAVLFYSGHGDRDADSRFYLLPVDVDVKDLLATGVSEDDMKKTLQSIPGRILLFLDACHSGAAGGDRRKSGLTDDIVRDLANDDYGLVLMASSMGREYSLENNEHRMSNFTVALVEGLSGKASLVGGVVYFHKLDAYVTDRVKELSQGRQHPVTSKPTSIRSFPLAKP